MVTIPPEVVRMRASSTVLVKASSRVNLLLAGIAICVQQAELLVTKSKTSGVCVRSTKLVGRKNMIREFETTPAKE